MKKSHDLGAEFDASDGRSWLQRRAVCGAKPLREMKEGRAFEIQQAAPLHLTQPMTREMFNAFARRLRARYQPQFVLTMDMQVDLLRLARADMDRMPKAHRYSA
jgi:hypothetical protein